MLTKRIVDDLESGVRLLQLGEVVAIPTETVYGLAGIAVNAGAVEKVLRLKGREKGGALTLLISSLDQLQFLASDLPPLFHKFAHAFLPGPLTLIVKKHPEFNSPLTGGLETVAIRYSSHPIAQKIVQMAGAPLVLPSANKVGHPSPTSANHVLEDFGGEIPAVIDGGTTTFGLDSTILSLENPMRPTLLRTGVISKNDLEKIAPIEMSPKAFFRPSTTRPALHLFSCQKEIELYLRMSAPSKQLIMSVEKMDQWDHFQLTATNLYEGLRHAVREGFSEVLVLCDHTVSRLIPLHNRLKQLAIS